MSVTLLADKLREERKTYALDGEALHLTIAGKYGNQVPYPVHIVPAEHGLLRGEVWFLQAKKPIPHVEHFCEMVNDNLLGVTLGFNPPLSRFFVGTLIDVENYKNDLAAIAGSCDVALPLCLHVGEEGLWHPHLIQLAFLNREQLETRH